MKNYFLIILALFCISEDVLGQNTLKGKTLTKQLDNINTYLNTKEYEKAIAMFYSKYDVISIENVPKKYIDTYNIIVKEIDCRENEFELSNKLVQRWENMYSNKHYEELYNSLTIIDSSECYQADYDKYNIIKSFIDLWGVKYRLAEQRYLKELSFHIDEDLDFEEQYDTLSNIFNEVQLVLSDYNELVLPEGDVPTLIKKINTLKYSTEHNLKALEEYLVKNKPLSLNEVDELIEDEKAIISDYHRYCINMGEPGFSDRFDNFDQFHIRMPDGKLQYFKSHQIETFIDKNIFNYFDIPNTRTELEKKIYAQTSDYKLKCEQMDSISKYIIDDRYFTILLKPYGSSCNVERGGLEFVTSTLLAGNLHTFYNENYLQFGVYCLSKPSDFIYKENKIFGGTNYFFEQHFYIPIATDSIALKVEQNIKNVKLMFVFKFQDTKKIGMPVYITAKVKQVLLYNDITNEIYCIKTY